MDLPTVKTITSRKHCREWSSIASWSTTFSQIRQSSFGRALNADEERFILSLNEELLLKTSARMLAGVVGAQYEEEHVRCSEAAELVRRIELEKGVLASTMASTDAGLMRPGN